MPLLKSMLNLAKPDDEPKKQSIFSIAKEAKDPTGAGDAHAKYWAAAPACARWLHCTTLTACRGALAAPPQRR